MKRINTGIPGFDEMLDGGIPENHIVSVIGTFGTGKTTFSLQFVYTGLLQGESCVCISLDESVKSMMDTAKLYGWDLTPFVESGKLCLLQLSASDIKTSVLRIESELPSLLKSLKPKRLVIDTITLFEMLFDDVAERRGQLFNLSQIIRETGATAILTSEASKENSYQSRFGFVEYISDGVILLKYVRPDDISEVMLAIEVIKMRRSKHSRTIKPYTITESGIIVLTESKVF